MLTQLLLTALFRFHLLTLYVLFNWEWSAYHKLRKLYELYYNIFKSVLRITLKGQHIPCFIIVIELLSRPFQFPSM